jgi:dihydrofolate reductase
VTGSNTYKTFSGPLKERINIVYSRSQTFPGTESTEDAPALLLKKLEARGFKEVAICGGEKIYTMFMKAKAIDRIYLTIEPILFGTGIRLFNEEMLFHLKLVTSAESESGSLLLEYAVDYVGNQKLS